MGSEMCIRDRFRTKGLKDIIRKTGRRKNLEAQLNTYPNKGINFEVWDKNWSEGKVISKYFYKTIAHKSS